MHDVASDVANDLALQRDMHRLWLVVTHAIIQNNQSQALITFPGPLLSYAILLRMRQSEKRIWDKEKRLCSLDEQVKRWSFLMIILTYFLLLGTCGMCVMLQTAKGQEASCRSWLVEELYRMLFRRSIWVLSCSWTFLNARTTCFFKENIVSLVQCWIDNSFIWSIFPGFVKV